MNRNRLSLSVLLSIGVVGLTVAQNQPVKQNPESTEIWKPVPPIVTPGAPSASVSGFTAPSDAIAIFDGSNLNNFVSARDGSAAKWTLADGAVTVVKGAGDIQTKQEFGDYQMHIEFRTPAQVVGNSQGRGNSGIFMQGRYELQVLDNYNNPTYSNGQVGSIYKQAIPLANPSRRPGEWQTYDIIYYAPRFNKSGMLTDAGRITVLLNGVLVQHNTQIKGTTEYIGFPKIEPHGRGPIRLQDHGDPVSFRNIWIREL
ncbi:DUF1080 domain-containing protein [Nibrella saemangeumensis]|uniref:DUF1080 domain-containing protein n=1 Tax=Nibrella saemangeumensis TaxID=1084526 RepID=A0ABP8MGV0_9BACT